MLHGLASQLIIHERIRTTETKAKRLRPVAERLVTLGKEGSVHSRRRALSLIEDREVIHKLFAEVAPRFADREGGYTRVLKLGPRQGDAAPMAIIEFVDGSEQAVPPAEAEQRRRRGLRRRKPAKPAADAADAGSEGAGDDIEEEPGIIQGDPGSVPSEAADDRAGDDQAGGDQAPQTQAGAAADESTASQAQASGEESAEPQGRASESDAEGDATSSPAKGSGEPDTPSEEKG